MSLNVLFRSLGKSRELCAGLVKQQMCYENETCLKAYRLSELIFFLLKVANIRCFILIAVENFHIIRK